MKKSDIDIVFAFSLYKENGSLHKTAKILHTNHMRLSALFKENNITINNVGKERIISTEDISNIIDFYKKGQTIEEISKKLHITVRKVRKVLKSNNISTGRWRSYVKKEKEKKIKIIKEKKEIPYKTCPYCEWKTYDINNYSHSYSKHILNTHKIDIKTHLEKYPEDYFYFDKIIKNRSGKIQCKICGKYLSLIDERHLKKHNISKQDYIKLYGDEIISTKCKIKLQNNIIKMNENPNWERFTSSYEKEIQFFLNDNNIYFETHNRSILQTNELDIFIPSKNIAIEFNGNKYHTEWWGGKTRQYHLNKTKKCKEKDIGLIHIFEDEFVNNKEIVFNKLRHIIGLQRNLPKIYGRKCNIKQVDKDIANVFLTKYHIQGYDPSTIHYGAYYNDELIAVMSFLKENKNNNNNWELTRFASNYNYICCGVGGKLFKHFIKEYNPQIVKSFADRRWTVDEENNLYIQLGFKFDSYTKPDYKYYNPKVDKYKRFHKFGFRKQILLKKYPDVLNPNKTETEMVKELGYDRIWDCGLIKYVWKKE